MKSIGNKRFLNKGVRGGKLKEDKLNTKYQMNYFKNSKLFGTITKNLFNFGLYQSGAYILNNNWLRILNNKHRPVVRNYFY